MLIFTINYLIFINFEGRADDRKLAGEGGEGGRGYGAGGGGGGTQRVGGIDYYYEDGNGLDGLVYNEWD